MSFLLINICQFSKLKFLLEELECYKDTQMIAYSIRKQTAKLKISDIIQ